MNDVRRDAVLGKCLIGPVAEIRNNRVEFFVPGLPVAQPRQRHAMIAGHVRNYTPTASPVNAFKATVKLACREALPDGWDFSAPMRMRISATFPRPKSKTKKRGANVFYPKTSKPDLDNLWKSIADALTGVAWNDDAQVWESTITKIVGSPDDEVGVSILIEFM